jgi:crotonobetainyl-CoA:carnitine CoA-transferase CaiB-like acyl-CoA transferase
VATLLALYRRDRTGESSFVAGSLLGSGALTVSETYRCADGTLAPVALLDGEQTGISPGRRLIQLDDGWIAVAADTTAQLAALQDIESTAAGRTISEVWADLVARHVPAEPVRLDQKTAFFDDPDNRSAGLVATYPSAEWGQMEQPGAWYFGDLGVRLELAPPALGEHTVSCLAEVGLESAAIDRLLADGVARQLTV